MNKPLCNLRIHFLIFLMFGAITGWTDEDRVLRTVQPDPLPVTVTLLPSFPSPRPSTLITEEALEQPLTQRYITQFTGPNGRRYINSVLERGSIYLPFIKGEADKRGLPWELAYLPIIESDFVITARSRSGAVGLWQFMLNSISPFSMKVDEYIDERRDFVKSTKGALAKLMDNYKALGSWELALAAYNAGLGGVTRIVRRTGVSDYWELSSMKEFRQETEHFVPKLVAAVYVIANHRKYGINVWHEPFEWISIPLERQVSIDVIAQEADINIDLLRRLNAQWLYGISPSGSGWQLVVPADKFEQVSELLERDDIKLIRYHYHIVRQGDTLWSISGYYDAPINMIAQHNPGITDRYLRIGETVIIPAFKDVPPPPVNQPAASAAATPATPRITTTTFNGSHVVQRGETFWGISRRYGVTPQTLAEANGMRVDQILHEGRVLKVPIIE